MNIPRLSFFQETPDDSYNRLSGLFNPIIHEHEDSAKKTQYVTRKSRGAVCKCGVKGEENFYKYKYLGEPRIMQPCKKCYVHKNKKRYVKTKPKNHKQ